MERSPKTQKRQLLDDKQASEKRCMDSRRGAANSSASHLSLKKHSASFWEATAFGPLNEALTLQLALD